MHVTSAPALKAMTMDHILFASRMVFIMDRTFV
jgi:hypothetical protein